MPSSIYVNGTSTRRPGVYANVDASALGGSALSAGNMAVVGDFPELPTATPVRFNTANSLKGASPSYVNQLIAKIIYNPANDDRVSGQPASVTLINGGTSTQAFTDLIDAADGTAAMRITSSVYGPLGNTGTVAVTASSDDRTVTINVNGTTEVFNFTGLPLADVIYTGTDASAMTLDIRDASPTKFTITQTRTAIASGALAIATGSWKWDAEPIFTASGSGNHSLSVSGIRKDTGAAFTTVMPFTASATPDTPLGFDVAAITALTWTPDAAETLSVTGAAFDLTLTDTAYKTILDVANHVNAYTAQGWDITVNEPIAGSIDSINMDRLAAADIFTPATVAISADLYRLIAQIDQSSLVDCDFFALPTVTAFDQVAAIVGIQNFAGGAFTAGDATSVAAAYTAARTSDVQVYAHFYDDLATQQELRTHCAYMAGLGLGECNGWSGVDDTKANLKTRTAGLNTRHIAFAPQEIEITDHTGATVWASPLYQAVMFASMQASTPVATPLTHKIANVSDVRTDSSWDSDQDADEMLQYGLCFLTSDDLGFKVERSITTYQTDDNPVFSEVSANESLYTSIRDLRENLSTRIGEPGVQATAATIRALAKDRLRYQVDNNIIKAFNGGSLSVEDLGDTFRVNVEIAVVEPTNFIEISAKVTRIPFSA